MSFNATNNVTTCPICPAGRFNHVVGGALNVSGCLGCPRGFYCRGGREKQACHAGTYSNATFLEHAEQCEKCPRGTYSPATALTSAHQCNKCPTGRVGNISGLTASDHCTPTEAGKYNDGKACLQGTYQDQEGQTSCKPCPAGRHGKHPNDGSNLYISEVRSCTNCTAGKYSSAKGISSEEGCNLCPAGRASATTGLDTSEKCTPTEAGKYNNGKVCLQGTYQDQAGQTACKPCPPGWYGNATGLKTPACSGVCPPGTFSFKGFTKCSVCDEGKYSQNASENCDYCPQFETTLGAGASACVCQRNMLRQKEKTCIYCSELGDGSACEDPGVTLANLRTEVGFFRSSSSSLKVYPCLSSHKVNATHHADCIGGNVSEQCHLHHMGPLCLVCEPGFTRHGAGVQSCQTCDVSAGERGLAYSLVVFACMLMSVGFVYGNYCMFSKEAYIQESPRQEQEHQIGEASHKTNLNERIRVMKTNVRMLGRLKIMIGWGQVASSVGTTFAVPWPPMFVSLIGNFSAIFNFDIFGFFSGFGCFFDASFGTNFIAHMLTLPLLLLLLVIAWRLALWRAPQVPSQMIKNRLIYAGLLLSFFMYPGLGVKICRVFKCREVDSVQYLDADVSQICYEGTHAALAGAAGVFVLAYLIGIPAWTYRQLRQHRGSIVGRETSPLDPNVQARYGHLFMQYKPAFWYEELVEMGRKLILTAGVSMLTSHSAAQLLIGILVCFANHTFILENRPFADTSDELLSKLAGIQIFLTLLFGIMLKVNVQSDQTAIDIMLVIITIAIIVLGAGMLIASVKVEWVQACRKRLRWFQGDQEQEAKEDSDPQSGLQLQIIMSNPMKEVGKDNSRWQSLVDEESGNTYYYDSNTGETTWEKP